ncbi:MAG: hypothetical protein GYA55_05755 [SAR324 cluster bacterium]|uniref:Uncharacterized protein n=1 Tax=SAR324 cluster bacterium TaxID=2024889 RepID=A0A7X9FQZ3_9DELT|nr:hypothetical protein [SAR324 cluster bacterium]
MLDILANICSTVAFEAIKHGGKNIIDQMKEEKLEKIRSDKRNKRNKAIITTASIAAVIGAGTLIIGKSDKEISK